MDKCNASAKFKLKLQPKQFKKHFLLSLLISRPITPSISRPMNVVFTCVVRSHHRPCGLSSTWCLIISIKILFFLLLSGDLVIW
jgi:hypothetical protein